MTDPIQEINKTLARCKCGSKAVMRYEPGCTFIHCIGEGKTVAAVLDWNPEGMAEEWNAQEKPGSYCVVGRVFKRHHGTVMHAVKKTNAKRECDESEETPTKKNYADS